MRILLQNSQTSLYYKSDTDWTRKEHEAFDFDNTTAAERMSRNKKLENAHIVVKFEKLPELRLVCR